MLYELDLDPPKVDEQARHRTEFHDLYGWPTDLELVWALRTAEQTVRNKTRLNRLLGTLINA
jgi:hypothetical protein